MLLRPLGRLRNGPLRGHGWEEATRSVVGASRGLALPRHPRMIVPSLWLQPPMPTAAVHHLANLSNAPRLSRCSLQPPYYLCEAIASANLTLRSCSDIRLGLILCHYLFLQTEPAPPHRQRDPEKPIRYHSVSTMLT